MGTDLIESKNDIIAYTDSNGLGEVIKPLTRDIHLFDTYIAGTSYLQDPVILNELKLGDKLFLQREDNRFDENAIMVLDNDKRKLGYIPERDNIVFARLMDAGKLLCGKIKKIDSKGTFRLINIEIYLIDF